MADFEKKFASHRMGPGGLTCPCCGPAPGKYRREFLRAAKRAARHEIKREIDHEIEDWFDWFKATREASLNTIKGYLEK